MKSDGAAVVIVGGGFSGTMVAADLARRGIASTLVDGSGREGRGTAYATPEDAHLLNVAAGRMAAWADLHDDFEHAVAAEGYGPQDFVPRRRYGEYLSNILDQALAGGLVRLVRQQAVGADHGPGGWAVQLADGSRATGQALVLAMGNQPPQPPPFARGIDGKLFVNDPWSEEGRAAITKAAASGGDVLLVGTGLTMVDVVLSLDEARHRGRIIALSRRGLAPRAHVEHEAAPIEWHEVPKGSVTALWRWLRRASATHSWRGVMDALRPHNQQLWQSLSLAEQRRFLRHARPWWDVHRHRIAPEVAGRIKRLVQLGQLEIAAGRVSDMWAEDGRLGVSIARRGKAQTAPPTIGSAERSPSPSKPREEQFVLAVNCTGPLGAMSQSRDPLLTKLFDVGLARPDALDLGIEVDQRSRILRHEPLAGSTQDERQMLWALGPLTKGRYWEITAVPDIRGQIAQLADDIAEELNHVPSVQS